jgi:hypothetical protein
VKQNGRKSFSALQIVPEPLVRTLAAPDDLTDGEKSFWRTIVESKPSDWFTADTGPLLAQYVRHATSANSIAVQLREFDPGWLKTDEGLKRYETLTRIADKESRALSTIATKLRLTPQSKITSPGAAATKIAKAPTRPIWER